MSMQMFRGFPLISDQVDVASVGVVWRELEKILNAKVHGDVVELGCYAGTTSLFIRRLLDEKGESAKRAFHVYDSFEGLPEKSREDQNAAGVDFKKGELAVSKKQFLQTFQRAGLTPPVTHKGWFDELGADDVPGEIAFAFLDGDFYGSILTSLKLVWPHMQAGSVVLIDDYKRETLPGVERAVRDFFQGKPAPRLRVEHNIAIIQA
ncbi:MAG TPA: TylF/MycF/NovP-related O-methyltransferase [Candidatus Saccharimonadales bacterium]